MSGSAGGSKVNRAQISLTLKDYEKKVLSKVPGYKSYSVSGSYVSNQSKDSFGDIDLILHIESSQDKKQLKKEISDIFNNLPDEVIVPFKSEKYKGKKTLNTGEIITVLYPVKNSDTFVQIDNIISQSVEEKSFKENFLNMPAEIQGLYLGLTKCIMVEEKPQTVLARLGIKTKETLDKDEELEFNLSSQKLTLRKVKLENFKEISRKDIWDSSDWNKVEKLLINFITILKSKGSFKDKAQNIKNKLANPRSSKRIKGVFNSMVSVKSGEVGTEKGNLKDENLNIINSIMR